jgi:hypothetical protein
MAHTPIFDRGHGVRGAVASRKWWAEGKELRWLWKFGVVVQRVKVPSD